MQRYNFQFTGQRFFRIENGRLAGQLRDVAYQATTTEFWGSMEAVGGPQTYRLGGAFNCGKGQPGQIAPVSHGCAGGAVPRRQRAQHHRARAAADAATIRAQSWSRRADRARRRCDGCVVIGTESTRPTCASRPTA